MRNQPALDLVAAYLDAFTAGDLETTATYLADDFTFDGPIAHYGSAREFLTGSRPFVERLRPGWTRVGRSRRG
jgi:ketosteroid isomerase-like protein